MADIVNWNPRRVGGRLRRLPRPIRRFLERPVNNFGDLLGPLIVERLLCQFGLVNDRSDGRRLLVVGSILHLARTGDVVWGGGRNGKVAESDHRFETLDVRSVRGPRTAAWLQERNIAVPPVFGDSALLLPRLLPELNDHAQTKRTDVLYVPNFNDLAVTSDARTLNPRSPLDVCLKEIVQSRFVVGSSLHAVIVAEAFGIPARAIRSRTELPFKYEDHFLGTGRPDFILAEDYQHALGLGGERPLEWDAVPLLEAFPRDLFSVNGVVQTDG